MAKLKMLPAFIPGPTEVEVKIDTDNKRFIHRMGKHLKRGPTTIFKVDRHKFYLLEIQKNYLAKFVNANARMILVNPEKYNTINKWDELKKDLLKVCYQTYININRDVIPINLRQETYIQRDFSKTYNLANNQIFVRMRDIIPDQLGNCWEVEIFMKETVWCTSCEDNHNIYRTIHNFLFKNKTSALAKLGNILKNKLKISEKIINEKGSKFHESIPK